MAASQSSFGAQTYGHGEAPDKKSFWLSVLAVLGCFLLFIAVMFVAYIPPNDVDSSGQTEVVQARLARLEELRAKEATAVDTYGWVNEPKGVVRIPVARAMALLPAQLAAGKVTVPAAAAPVPVVQPEPAADGEASQGAAAAEPAKEQADAAGAQASAPAAE